MKIAMVSDTLLTGGAERQMLLSASELAKGGHEVDTIIYYPEREYHDFIKEQNINVVGLEIRGTGRVARIRALARYFKERKFDVVHAFKGCATISTSIAARMAGTRNVFGGFRSVCDEHGAFRLALKMADRAMAGWVVNSQTVADSMVRNLSIDPRKLSVVCNGISSRSFRSALAPDEARAKLGLSRTSKTVAMLARLTEVKNHRMLLKATQILVASVPELRVLVVGTGPLMDPLVEFARSCGIDENVLFLGNRSDIGDLLAATDIAVLTSNSEGFPNALLEPMSVGIPVISTDYPAIHELVENSRHGYIVPRNSHVALADRIMELLGDERMRRAMGAVAADLVGQKFAPMEMANRLAAVYMRKL